LSCIFFLAHVKQFFPTGRYPVILPSACLLPLPCARTRCTAKTFFCRVFPSGWSVCFPTAHDKVICFKKIIFALLLISPLLKHYFVLYISNVYMSR
jgi:hypothetical protein